VQRRDAPVRVAEGEQHRRLTARRQFGRGGRCVRRGVLARIVDHHRQP